jgi:hypothetical protein
VLLLIGAVTTFGLRHWFYLGIFLILIAAYCLDRVYPMPTPSDAGAASVESPSLYLNCEVTGIPITVAPNSIAHMMMVMPSLFEASQNFPSSVGVFMDINTQNKSIGWPTKGDGRYLTKEEFVARQTRYKTPSPLIHKCDLSILGNQILDELTIPVTLGPNDREKSYARTFQISVNPLRPAEHYVFYVINRCDAQDLVLAWPEKIRAHMVGDNKSDDIPFRIAKHPDQTNQLYLSMSTFKWNNADSCDWHW